MHLALRSSGLLDLSFPGGHVLQKFIKNLEGDRLAKCHSITFSLPSKKQQFYIVPVPVLPELPELPDIR